MLVFEGCVLPKCPSIAIVKLVRGEGPEDGVAERLVEGICGLHFLDIGG